MPRSSRPSRQSVTSTPIHTLEHDAVAVALQEALGARVLLIRTIGEGGMGRVYLARDPQLKRFVAVKVLLQSQATNAESHARFQREAQSIAAISHPNVVQIYGVGELPDGRPYFIMQYVAGGSMAERLTRSGPLPVEAAETVIGDVAAALAAAHRRGIIHRDVKPANVLWDEDGERATVSDFGIAALQPTEDAENDIRITGSGMAVGSPAYMSPEQILTEPVTAKSDIYALGLLGYELLTGRGPYHATKPSDVVAAHLRDSPRRLSEARTDIPETLQDLLLRCLAKDQEDRPTAEEVMLAMTPGAADALEWPPPGLERLRGALWGLAPPIALGAAFLLVPLIFLVEVGSFSVGESALAMPLFLAVSMLFASAAFIRAAQRTWVLGNVLVRSSRLGYGWGTVVEVMADRRGDTGSVIAGTREYGSLPVAERTTLRVLRVVQALALFSATPLALVAAILALMLRREGSSSFATATLSVFVLVGSVGVLARLYEGVRLSRIRRKRAERPHHKNESTLAPSWYAAFERSREGQGFGRGSAVNGVMTALLVSSGALLVLFCAAAILAASVITVAGQVFNSRSIAFAYSELVSTAQSPPGGGSYRIPTDGRVTPIEAGEALLAINSATNKRKASPLERRVNNDYPPWHRVVPPRDVFPASKEMTWTSAAILTAAKGLTPAQREALMRASAHPARDELSHVALASSADLYGALLRLPLIKPLYPFDFPVVILVGLRDAAESHAALAALDVADQRPLDAERHAREIISVGELVLDMHQGINLGEGRRLVEQGVGTLEAVYVATGRERDARVLLDSMVASTRTNPRRIRPGIEGLQRAMRDTTIARGARMELLLPLVMRVCADPKELLFGVDEDYRRDVRYARDSLARYPSERAWVDAVDSMLTLGAVPIGGSSPPSPLVLVASVIDAVVGGKRFESCAGLTTQLSGAL
ncbi:MAG: serine/threonine protein kinase [Gemmatimonadetes bacterium]|nr:serine/threonine protein kinase [Gemmatimonadota bacterium]